MHIDFTIFQVRLLSSRSAYVDIDYQLEDRQGRIQLSIRTSLNFLSGERPSYSSYIKRRPREANEQ